jgi:hypothetical protein
MQLTLLGQDLAALKLLNLFKKIFKGSPFIERNHQGILK